MSDNLYPITDRLLARTDRQSITKQTAKVIWFYGISGSGKSTLAIALEKQLHVRGLLSYVLDGDNIRTGLNSGLGFSDDDRFENIRRIAEVSKLFVDAGVITLNSFITPKEDLRGMMRGIIGKENLIEIYVKASFEVCRERDVKGLYAKAEKGLVPQFTGKDSGFEEPANPDLVIDTSAESVDESLAKVVALVLPEISAK
ncbi:adenylyl-sulfate kinase [Puniceicoccaceae bacterium K14]|nr:adenylyl-sulfate kinase [Puniceicoccaceae bacterium K14]